MRMIQFRREKWCEWEISKRKVLWASKRVHGYSSEEFGRWLEWIRWIGEGNGSPLQYSCLENPMDGGAWWAAVHGVPKRVGHDWATSFSLFTFMHWRRKWQPTPVFLPGESRWRGCRLCGRTESDTTEATEQQQQQHIVITIFSVRKT